jgi:hypothetical protein
VEVPDRPGQNDDAAITAELRALGYEIDSVYELRNRYDRWPDAVPVLAAWLPRVSALGLQESMLRSLTVRQARKHALDAVIAAFVDIEVPEGDRHAAGVRWAAGNALEVLWDDSRFEELRALCVDQSYGPARQMVVRGLARSKRPEAVETAIALLDDDDVRVPAVLALRRMKPPPRSGAREALERAKLGQEAWVVEDIDKTLAALPR